jgi:hypothetical protein
MISELLERNGKIWATGANLLAIGEQHGQHHFVVSVTCLLGSSETEFHALLDTAAQWSVLPSGMVDAKDMQPLGVSIEMSTRRGTIRGECHEVTVRFPAAFGSALEISAKVLVADDWTGPPVLGFRGLLEVMRFAVHPGTSTSDLGLFFFGSADAA